MFKTLLIALLGTIFYNSAIAQNASMSEKDTLAYYLDKNNRIVEEKDKAAYLLFVYPADANEKEKLFPFKQYHPNGKIKSIGFSSEHSPFIVAEGQVINFFPNGKRQSTYTYKKGRPIGLSYQNYSNGKLYAILDHGTGSVTRSIECRDSTGNILAENGNGKWVELDESATIQTKYTQVTNTVLGRKWYPMNDTTRYAYYASTGPVLTRATIAPSPLNIEWPNTAEFIAGNLDYPQEDIKSKTEGRVSLKFVVEKDGVLTHLSVKESPSATLAAEALRLMALMSPWKPGSASDLENTDRLETEAAINFSLYGADDRSRSKIDPSAYLSYLGINHEKEKPLEDLSKADKQPEFPGGLEGFNKFVQKRLRYPFLDGSNGVSGRVIAQFVVAEDGSLIDVKAMRGPSSNMMKEVERVIKLSPKWKPAILDNKPVKFRFIMPVEFFKPKQNNQD